MPEPGDKVLRVNTVEETTRYRNAVSQILLNIQQDTGKTLVEIAADIDVSQGTIGNASNKKADLSSTYLKRLGEKYGPSYLDPYINLVGGRVIPLESERVADILPFVARVNFKIAQARSPSSPGGTREIHTEQLEYLPDLIALQREMSALIQEIREKVA